MKLNCLKSIFPFLLSALLLSSCTGNDNNGIPEPSSAAHFVSLTFAKNDSIPNLEKAVFKNVYEGGDSIIVNLDSLPYLTRIDSVLPTFRFASRSAAYLVYKNIAGEDSLRLLSSNDTIDFTVPMRVRNISSDKTTTLEYGIKVNVHQVEPELYVWNQVVDRMSGSVGSNQHSFLFNGTIYYYSGTGINNYLYTAPLTNYANWTDNSGSLAGLPATTVEFRHMQIFKNKFYLFSSDNKIYSSSDGRTWSDVAFPNAGYKTTELLFVFLDKLWGIVQDVATQRYYFASTEDAANWTIGSELDSEFPIEQYTAISFKTRLGVPKAIIVGGKQRVSPYYPYVWSTEDGTRWVNFKRENNTRIEGASVVSYDGKILMFQGTDDNHLRESINEGFLWNVPDTAYNNLPEEYARRSFQSVFVNESDKRIFIIGGYDYSTLSDVWTGKLNRAYWE